MIISLIVAMDQNRLIGNQNQLPWHLSADLKYFKRVTIGKPIIMGRKTYESIGRALPGRQNIVLTQSNEYSVEGCNVVNSIDQAIEVAGNAEEIMVIGGCQVYAAAMPHVTRMYLTLIDHEFSGDAYFPAWEANQWQEVERETHLDPEQNFSYHFVMLDKITC